MVSRETDPLLQVNSLSKFYGGLPVLQDVSLQVQPGEIIGILGPSGSGKSTLLRCIAGLEPLESGDILFRGITITQTPVHQRGFGMMFQQFALFPHRTVAENVAFGLKMQRRPLLERQQRVQEMLELVGLRGYGERTIFELSGGEQQRVALARSLAPRPALLMLDEPLGSLDRTLRERLMDELRLILKEVGLTALYVTHDQQEAFAISDRLLLLNRGQIVQEGTPEQLYRHPASRFVAEFFGLSNIIPVHATHAGSGPSCWVANSALGPLHLESEGQSTRLLLLRPEAATLDTVGAVNVISGRVCERSFRGGHYRLMTEHEGKLRLEWEITTPEHDLPPVGEPITLALRPDALTFLPE